MGWLCFASKGWQRSWSEPEAVAVVLAPNRSLRWREHQIDKELEKVAQTVKRLPTMQETWLRSLGREDPLEKEMATHSSNSCLEKSHGQRSLVGYSPWGGKESDTTEWQRTWLIPNNPLLTYDDAENPWAPGRQQRLRNSSPELCYGS